MKNIDQITHVADGKKGSFFYELNGTRMAKRAYVMAGDDKISIDHMEVEEALKGQGIGKRLQAELVEYVRAHHIQVIPLCPPLSPNLKQKK